MPALKRVVPAAQLLLVFPAALLMGALVVRRLHSLHGETAHTAQQIIMWYAGRMWTLWLLLVTLPFAVLVTGSITFLRSMVNRELPQGVRSSAISPIDPAMLPVGALTLAAAVILAIVALHILAN